jgi:quercetin dioxygenase-like cupin family protein
MNNDPMSNTFSLHTPDRLLDAALLCFELTEATEKLKQEDTWKMGERTAITLMKSTFMRIVLIAMHGQSEINFHQSGNVISVQLLQGKVNFQTASESVMLKKGSLITIHEDTKHTLIAIEESVFLLTIAICPMNQV